MVLCLVSCSKDLDTTNNSSNLHKASYWVNTVDSFWVLYSVDSTNYIKSQTDSAVTIRTSQSFIRETFLEELTDFSAPYPRKVRMEVFDSIGSIWRFFRDFKVINTDNQYSRDFDNIKTVTIQKPVEISTRWKGNSHIDTSILDEEFADWGFQYQNIDQAYTIQGYTFGNTITVLQVADSNAIEKRYSKEIYAKDIGLIQSTYQILEKQEAINPWTQPENGIVVNKRIVDWKGR